MLQSGLVLLVLIKSKITDRHIINMKHLNNLAV